MKRQRIMVTPSLSSSTSSSPDQEPLMRDHAASIPPGSPEPKLLLSAVDVARLISLSRAEVYLLHTRGQLRGVRYGRRILFPRAAVEAFVARLINEQHALG